MVNLLSGANRAKFLDRAGPIISLCQQVAPIATWPWLSFAVSLAMLNTILIPLNLLGSQPFHHDEALYATWALEIASGQNPFLQHIPIDKPPLFLYAAAGAMRLLGPTETAARLPSLVATMLGVGLAFGLGQKLYGRGVGVLAAWLAALSPFTLLFAPTAFTDPLLVTLVLAACLAAAYKRAGWAGAGAGLAIATKQQGLFFVPLIAGLLLCAHWQEAGRNGATSSPQLDARHRQPSSPLPFHFSGLVPILQMLLTTGLLLGLTLAWDLARDQSPGFWQQSLVNYNDLATDPASFGQRWSGFVELLQYGTGSSVLNTIFVLGLPLLLLYTPWRAVTNKRHAPHEAGSRIDWLFSLFILAFLLGHALFSFQVWDRYLLGLMPFLALLLARVLLLPWAIAQDYWLNGRPAWRLLAGAINGLALSWLLVMTLTGPVQAAANARYPLGSNSRALQGIEQITAYLQGHVGANTTLYHRWLGAHWRFYLWEYPYDLQYWASPQMLAARARPGHLIAFPAWQSETEARLALAGAGLELQEISRAYTPAGYPSVILYRLVARPGETAK